MKNKQLYDVIIIGGSYAGLSAAMTLGRLLKSVLILDSGTPSNSQTPQSHNFITQDGQKPAEISRIAKEQVLNYKTVVFKQALALAGSQTPHGFEITTDKQEVFRSKKLLFATGIKDHLPNIKGLKQSWGISAIHCPFCHGYEFKNKKTALLAPADKALHLASLLKHLTQDITVLTQGNTEFSSQQIQILTQNNIGLIPKEILELRHHQGYIQEVVFQDHTSIALQALYLGTTFEQQCSIAQDLGCELTKTGHIAVDGFQKTTVEGIYACGDATNASRSVATAVASGSTAAIMAIRDLSLDFFNLTNS